MRTIDADAIPYTMIYRENWMRGTGGEEQAAWKSSIDAMPTIEPERKKGEWIENGKHNYTYKCSVCGAIGPLEPIGEGVFKFSFCPNCGADMR